MVSNRGAYSKIAGTPNSNNIGKRCMIRRCSCCVNFVCSIRTGDLFLYDKSLDEIADWAFILDHSLQLRSLPLGAVAYPGGFSGCPEHPPDHDFFKSTLMTPLYRLLLYNTLFSREENFAKMGF